MTFTLDWSTIVTVILAVGTPTGLIGGYVMLRREGREQKADAPSAVAAWVAVAEASAGQAERASASAIAAGTRAEEAHVLAQQAKASTEHMQRVLSLHVLPIIHWIDAGAPPPPPPIADELRRILALDD